MKAVVYPGSFNPITNGHTDLVERALSLFDHVILAIGTSAQKNPKVDLADRTAIASPSTASTAFWWITYAARTRASFCAACAP